MTAYHYESFSLSFFSNALFRNLFIDLAVTMKTSFVSISLSWITVALAADLVYVTDLEIYTLLVSRTRKHILPTIAAGECQ